MKLLLKLIHQMFLKNASYTMIIPVIISKKCLISPTDTELLNNQSSYRSFDWGV